MIDYVSEASSLRHMAFVTRINNTNDNMSTITYGRPLSFYMNFTYECITNSIKYKIIIVINFADVGFAIPSYKMEQLYISDL